MADGVGDEMEGDGVVGHRTDVFFDKLVDGEGEMVDRVAAAAPELPKGIAAMMVLWARGKDGAEERAIERIGRFSSTVEAEHDLSSATVDEVEGEIMTEKMQWWVDETSGEALFYLRGRLHDPTAFTATTTMRTMWIIMTHVLAYRGIDSVNFCFDAHDMGWENISIEDEKVFSEAISGCLPVRIRNIVGANATMFMRIVVNILWPFLPPKFRERMVFMAPGDTTELHHRLPRTIIPETLGGTAKLRTGLELMQDLQKSPKSPPPSPSPAPEECTEGVDPSEGRKGEGDVEEEDVDIE